MSEKKVGKRLLTWVLVLVMTLSLLPLNVLAAHPVGPAKVIRPDDNKYLTYQFYVGEDKVAEQIIKTGDTLREPEVTVQNGKRLTGWYTENDTLFDGFGEYTETIEKNSTVNLYAKFEDVYYVYFKDTTTGRIVATKEGVTGAEITFDDVSFPVESDESITGWYLEGDSGKTAVTSVTLESTNVTLCAIVEKGHWITFDSKGGSNVAPQFVRSGESCAAPSAPTKPGYDFDGWYDGDIEFSFGGTLDSNKDLTAHWTAKNAVNYTVIHWLENADDTAYSYKESVQMFGAAGSKTAATAKSYEGFTAQAITQQTINGDGSTIVNVHYKRNVYEVKFFKYSRRTWTEIADKRITAKFDADISKQWPGGIWKTSPDGSTFQANIRTMPLDGYKFYETSQGYAKAYYYLQGLDGKYELDHTDKGARYTSTVTKEDQYPITGYTFNEGKSARIGDWYSNANFYYDRSSFNVVYVDNAKTVHTQSYLFGASIVNAGDYKLTTPPAGKEGYVFAGWYSNELCAGDAFNFNSTMPAQNITVYAKWVEPVHKVEFVVDNSVVTKWTKPNVAHNSTISDLPTPESSNGDTFLGWVDANGKPFHPSTKITDDLTLHAKFGNKAGYSVTYVTAEGSSSVTDDKLYAEGAYATVRNGPSTAPKGEVFLYWTNNGKKYYPNDKVLVPKDGVTLTAVYGPVDQALTLTYHSNYPDGTDTTALESNLKNNARITVAASNKFSPPIGYEFDCWNTKADGTGPSFAAGSSARVDKVEPNVLYAQWKKTTIDEEVIVTITGNSDTKVYNGSEQSVTGFTTDVGEKDITVTLKEPGKGTAKGTNVGTYWMGLTPESFAVTSSTYTNIKVVVNDGKLEITPITDEVTVTINGNTDTKVYNASEQSVSGYTTDVNGKTISVALKEGSKAEAKGTDVNTYNMGLTADSFAVTSTNYSNIKVVVNDGYLEITPVTDEVTVTITGNTKTVMYNGSEQSVTGYTTDVGDKTIDVVLNATGKDTAKNTKVGKYYMGLTTNDFAVTSTNYTNINVIVVDGWLEITPITQTATVTITGNHNSVKYNGREQSVTGFTYTAPEGVTVTLNAGSKAEAKGTDKGTYYMGLTKDDFTVTSDIYKEFKIVVNDGYLEITRSGGHHPRPKPTVEIEDDDALGLNTTDHFAYVVGYGNGEVRPQNNITRAEVATIFFRLLTDDVRDENLTKTNRYSDVAATSWYNTAVSTLSSMGIITGYPDGTFRPNAAITRAEFAAIAARFDSNGDKTTAKFSDIATHWAKDEISIAYNNGWINGYPNGTFGPQRDITRAETMTLVNRVLNRQPETEEDLLPNMVTWTDNADKNAWYYLAVQEATNSHYYKFKTNSKYEKWTELRETRDWTLLEK